MTCSLDLIPINPIFDKAWNWPGPSRIKAHLWKLCHGRLMTNTERKVRCMTVEDLCPRCSTHLESNMHMIKDCEDLKAFWSSLIDPSIWSKFFSIGFHCWLDWNLSSKDIGKHSTDWPIIFGVAVNEIWKERNSIVFTNNSPLGGTLGSENWYSHCAGSSASVGDLWNGLQGSCRDGVQQMYQHQFP